MNFFVRFCYHSINVCFLNISIFFLLFFYLFCKCGMWLIIMILCSLPAFLQRSVESRPKTRHGKNEVILTSEDFNSSEIPSYFTRIFHYFTEFHCLDHIFCFVSYCQRITTGIHLILENSVFCRINKWKVKITNLSPIIDRIIAQTGDQPN